MVFLLINSQYRCLIYGKTKSIASDLNTLLQILYCAQGKNRDILLK